MDPLVSVIVPAYNAEKYIEKCLDSLIQQTYKNLQIIVIDDGSKDNTPQILDEYAKKDARIEVVHKENGGVAVARNVALDMVKGQYVHFCDADDWMGNDVYRTAVRRIQTERVDLFIMNSYVHTKEDEPVLRIKSVPSGKYNKIALLKYSCGTVAKNNAVWTCFLSVTNKVFDVSLFNDKEGKPIRFKEGMKYLEDGNMLVELFDNVKTGYYDKTGYYNIRKNDESAMGKLDVVALSEQMLNGYKSLLDSRISKSNHIANMYIRNAYRRAALFYAKSCLNEGLDEGAEAISESFKDDEEFQTEYRGHCMKLQNEIEENLE